MKVNCIILLLVIGQFSVSFALSEEQGKASPNSKKIVLAVRCRLLVANEALEFLIVNNSDFDILLQRDRSGLIDFDVLVDGHLVDTGIGTYGPQNRYSFDLLRKNIGKNESEGKKREKGESFSIIPSAARVVNIAVDETEMRSLFKKNATIKLKLRVFEIKGGDILQGNEGLRLGKAVNIKKICDVVVIPNGR